MNVYLAEFLGTAILILFGGGVCANVNLKRSAANGADWIVITAGWGLAVTMGVYAVGQFSGAHLNPAVSLALALDGSFDWSLVPGYNCCSNVRCNCRSNDCMVNVLATLESDRRSWREIRCFLYSTGY